MAREAVRNEPLVSCSLKERGLSTTRVAYLYVPLGDVVIRLALCTSCTLFFFFFLFLFFFFGIGTNYMLARDGNLSPTRGYPVRSDPNGPDFTRSD